MKKRDLLNVDDAFLMMAEHNLENLAHYNNTVRILLSEKYREIKNDLELEESAKNWELREFNQYHPRRLAHGTFLMMFGHLEEMLEHLFRSYNPHGIERDRGSGFEQYISYLANRFGDQFSSDKCYQFIRDAQKVRNSLIHVSGHVSLSKTPKEERKLRDVADRKPKHFSIDNGRIGITLAGLREFNIAVDGFVTFIVEHTRRM